VVDMQMNWRIAERTAPLHHASKQVGMRHCQT
jgi:hypothetical protein